MVCALVTQANGPTTSNGSVGWAIQDPTTLLALRNTEFFTGIAVEPHAGHLVAWTEAIGRGR